MSENTRKSLRYLVAVLLPMWLCAGTVFLITQQSAAFMGVMVVLALLIVRADWAVNRRANQWRDERGYWLYVDEGAMLLQWRQGIDLPTAMTLREFSDDAETGDDTSRPLRELLLTPSANTETQSTV